jgi:hypothetical protein
MAVRRWLPGAIFLAVIGGSIWAAMGPPLTPAEQAQQALRSAARQQQEQLDLEIEKYLCRKMAACRKYDQARLQCAAAGNFKNCLRIKLDNDLSLVDPCGGNDEGRPAASLDPRTPNALRCFFLNQN